MNFMITFFVDLDAAGVVDVHFVVHTGFVSELNLAAGKRFLERADASECTAEACSVGHQPIHKRNFVHSVSSLGVEINPTALPWP